MKIDEGDIPEDTPEEYGEILPQDKVYARLIDKTYEGDTSNFGNYVYVNSLRLHGSIMSSFVSNIFGGLSEGGQEIYINHYYDTVENKDVFAVRGTKGMDDVINDGLTIFNEKLGYTPEAVDDKIQKYTRFVMNNTRSGKAVVVGHSLGSLDVKYMSNSLKTVFGDDVTTIGYAHPVWNAKGLTRAYVYENDPLYAPLGRDKEDNLIVLQKPYDRTKGLFENFHSTKNFYN